MNTYMQAGNTHIPIHILQLKTYLTDTAAEAAAEDGCEDRDHNDASFRRGLQADSNHSDVRYSDV